MSAETSRRQPPNSRGISSPAIPSIRLLVDAGRHGLSTILAFCLYTVHEVQQLRDEQTRISERNRLDSLQLLRIQNNLSELAFSMRDMADRTDGYPMVSWRQTFDRLKADLDQAIATEQTLAPAERPQAQQERLVSSVVAFWTSVDEAFARAQAGHDDRTALLVRTSVEGQRQHLAVSSSRSSWC